MLLAQVAVVSQVDQIQPAELMRVSAALQKQALRDFGPVWDVSASVDAFATLEDVPIGYWPIVVETDIGFPGAAGIHLDKDGQPFSLVSYSDSWSLTASHECLEMLADPFGNRLIAGPSLKSGQGRVEYLVEVCDPSEAAQFGYTANGVLVSDFYTPHFFDPVKASGVRYSFTGAITKPREVLKGGYISWHDPVSDHWWQQTFFGAQRKFRDLGVLTGRTGSLRETIDGLTEVTEQVDGLAKKDSTLLASVQLQAAGAKASNSKAEAWAAQIAEIKRRG